MNNTYLAIIIVALSMSCIYQITFIKFFDSFFLRRKYSNIVISLVIIINLMVITMQRIYLLSDFIVFFFQIFLMTFVIKTIYYIDWSNSLFIAIISRFYVSGISHIFISIASFTFKIPILDTIANSNLYGLLFIFGRATTIILLIIFWHIYIKPKIGRKLSFKKNQLNQFVLLQLLNSFLLQVTLVTYVIDIKTIYFSITLVIIMSISFIYSLLFYENTLELTEKSKSDEYINQLETQIIRQTDHYTSFSEEINRFKKLDHDYTSMLQVLESLLGNKPTAETNEFINEFVEEIKSVQNLTHQYSNNLVVDALLAETHKICKKKNIQFHAKVYLDERLKINSFTIVRVASNVIRNAIDACMKVPKEERYISFETIVNGPWSIFVVKNSYNGNLFYEDHRIVTSKDNKKKYGNGLQIIRDLTEKVNGITLIDPAPDKKEFCIKFLFKVIE